MSEVEDSKAKPDDCEKTCGELLEEYQKTGNPLFAWLAVQTWLGRQCTPAQEGALMPEAMREFLRDTSDAIMGLAVAVALTTLPTRAQRERIVKNGGLTAKLSADDAMKILPEALKLRRRGGSPFKDFARQVRAEYWTTMFDAFRRAGLSRTQALAAIGYEAGEIDYEAGEKDAEGNPKGIREGMNEREVLALLKGGRIRRQKRRARGP